VKPKKVCAQCGMIKNHSVHLTDHDFVDPRPAGISPVGQRMTRFNQSDAGKEYRAQAKATRGQPCQIVSPVCTGFSEHLHEPLSRGRAGGIEAALRDGPEPIPCCDACNGWVSEHPVWAREKGLLVSRKDIDL
jgi:hypothetical protein